MGIIRNGVDLHPMLVCIGHAYHSMFIIRTMVVMIWIVVIIKLMVFKSFPIKMHLMGTIKTMAFLISPV